MSVWSVTSSEKWLSSVRDREALCHHDSLSGSLCLLQCFPCCVLFALNPFFCILKPKLYFIMPKLQLMYVQGYTKVNFVIRGYRRRLQFNMTATTRRSYICCLHVHVSNTLSKQTSDGSYRTTTLWSQLSVYASVWEYNPGLTP